MNAPVLKRPFDVAAVRKEFPILARKVHGRPLVYLDNAASAQKPNAVIDAMAGQMRTAYANVHRGIHALANETTQGYEAARAKVARFLNAASPEQIVFTKGGTQAINIVANGLALKPGDEIIVSVLEHHSNIVPWHLRRERDGAVLKWLEADEDGRFDPAALEALITPRTKMVALTHCSNVLGMGATKELVARAQALGAPVLLDGCQAVVHDHVDVTALGVDFYAFTGHKLYGPTGVGVLYGKPERLAALRPFEGGGEMIDIVERERITYNDPPHRFEAGTPPIIEAVGLGAAIDWLAAQDRAAIRAHENSLRDAAMEGLRGLNWVKLHGAAPEKAAIVSFSVDGAHPHDVAQLLDQQGVAVRAGHHCAQPLMSRLGVSATARASFSLYNSLEEVEAFIEALQKARKMLV
ncbi:MAG: aminotransferase class V-fold PLP-dependent enzyme [Hyphomonadaceae bacterium]